MEEYSPLSPIRGQCSVTCHHEGVSICHTLREEVFKREAREVGRDILDEDEDRADDEATAEQGVEVRDPCGGQQLRGEQGGPDQ